MQKLILKERYDKVFDKIQRSASKGKIHPEESKLRISLPIKNGQSVYSFNPKAVSEYFADQALDRNDVFVVNSIGVFPTLRSTNNQQIEHHFSFVPVNDGTNPSVFPVAFKSDALEALYGGRIQIRQDNNVVMSALPMEKYKKVPETQGAFLLDGEGAAVNEGIQTEWSLDKATELMLPCFTIAGTRDTKIEVTFDASGLTFPVTEGYEAYLVLYIDGFLIKGGCEWYNNENPFGDVVGMW